MPPAPEQRMRKKFGSGKERIKERALLVATCTRERSGSSFAQLFGKSLRVFAGARLLLRRRQLKLRAECASPLHKWGGLRAERNRIYNEKALSLAQREITDSALRANSSFDMEILGSKNDFLVCVRRAQLRRVLKRKNITGCKIIGQLWRIKFISDLKYY